MIDKTGCMVRMVLLAVGLYFADAVDVMAAGVDPERGAVLFALAGGCGCHTPEGGPVGAGGRAIETPFGRFYGTNITPDPETGIGGWSDEEIVVAIRDGYVRERGVEAPVMPYYLYAGMSDQDVGDLVAYLRMLEPVNRPNLEHEVKLPFPRLAYRAWRWWFASGAAAPKFAPRETLARGRYFVDHVAVCVDCHTQRNRLGALDQSMYLAGTTSGPNGEPVPNITPDAQTGIGSWDLVDIESVLRMGMLPNFDSVQGSMAEVVDGVGGGPGYSDAPEEELRAIAAYLRAVLPIENEVGE